jgi:hypothetical protein
MFKGACIDYQLYRGDCDKKASTIMNIHRLVTSQERPRDATLELAKRLDCQGDTDEMIDCLRRTNVKDLITKANDMYVSNRPKLT